MRRKRAKGKMKFAKSTGAKCKYHILTKAVLATIASIICPLWSRIAFAMTYIKSTNNKLKRRGIYLEDIIGAMPEIKEMLDRYIWRMG
jgi:hypothetical protein